MSINFPPLSNAYSQNAGISPLPHIAYSTVDPGSTTIQSNTGFYQAGQLLLNLSSGNLWYLKSFSTSNGVMSANWALLEVGGSSPTFTNVIITGTLNVTGLTTLGALTQIGTASINATGSSSTTIGNLTGGATNLLSGGTLTLDTAAAQNITIGASQTTGLMNIGGTGVASGTVTAWGGTGNQTINVANSTGNKTLVLGSTSGTSAITLQAGTAVLTGSTALGGFNATGDAFGIAGDLIFGTAGGGLEFTEGANAVSGLATLVAGTISISTNAVSTTCRIEVTRFDINSSTALGSLTTSSRVNGTSFDIRSVDPTTPANLITGDVSIVYWQIVESR